MVKDSARIDTNGEFIFLLQNSKPGIYRIQIQSISSGLPTEINLGIPGENYIHIYIYGTRDTITIQANGAELNRSYQIQGNPECILFQQIRDLRLPFFDTLRSSWSTLENAPSVLSENYPLSGRVILQPMETTLQNVQHALYTFIDSTTNPIAGLLAVAYCQLSLKDGTCDSFLEASADKWSQTDSTNTYIRSFIKNIRDQKIHLSTGSVVPDIILPGTSGYQNYLSEIQARIILINFWTTSCQECCTLNITLINPLLRRYRDQGFTVFSVALDVDNATWQGIVEKNKLDGIQVTDVNKISASTTARLYRVQNVPDLFLIDSEGYLIARNPDPRQLEGLIRAYLESN